MCSRKHSQRGEGEELQARISNDKATRSLRIRDVHLYILDRRAMKIFINESSPHDPLISNCRLHFTPDTGAEVNAIGLQHLHLLGLGKGNLSKCQNEVSTADRSLLHSGSMYKARLTLGSAAVNNTISVFHDINDCLLSW